MKPIPSNALRRQLAQGQAAGPHPEADLLTAFAENTLLERERTEMLVHLAGCADCRAIVHAAAGAEPDLQAESLPELVAARRARLDALAEPVVASSSLPAAPAETHPPRPPVRRWLPGVALAGALFVMAASTVLFYRALHSGPQPVQTASSAPAAPAPAESAPPPADKAVAAAPKPVSPVQGAPQRRLRAAAHAAGAVPGAEQAHVGAAAAPPRVSATDAFVRGSATGFSGRKSEGAKESADASGMQSEQRAMSRYASGVAAPPSLPPAATESVQVEARPAFAGGLQSGQRVSGFASAPAARAHFRINDAGQLERSAADGVWSPVPIAADAHIRVLAISGDEVWAGGDHLRLFHSADDGLTWTEVPLPETADRAHAVVHIRLDAAPRVVVEDDAGSAWATKDAGKSWKPEAVHRP